MRLVRIFICFMIFVSLFSILFEGLETSLVLIGMLMGILELVDISDIGEIFSIYVSFSF